jgi:hypothetical protein
LALIAPAVTPTTIAKNMAATANIPAQNSSISFPLIPNLRNSRQAVYDCLRTVLVAGHAVEPQANLHRINPEIFPPAPLVTECVLCGVVTDAKRDRKAVVGRLGPTSRTLASLQVWVSDVGSLDIRRPTDEAWARRDKASVLWVFHSGLALAHQSFPHSELTTERLVRSTQCNVRSHSGSATFSIRAMSAVS